MEYLENRSEWARACLTGSGDLGGLRKARLFRAYVASFSRLSSFCSSDMVAASPSSNSARMYVPWGRELARQQLTWLWKRRDSLGGTVYYLACICTFPELSHKRHSFPRLLGSWTTSRSFDGDAIFRKGAHVWYGLDRSLLNSSWFGRGNVVMTWVAPFIASSWFTLCTFPKLEHEHHAVPVLVGHPTRRSTPTSLDGGIDRSFAHQQLTRL